MSTLEIELPTEGDVIELILEDHRTFEALLRDLRDASCDRHAVRETFATLHVAHALAEERAVYPNLRKDDAISAHDAHHGEEEHAEGNQALLAVLEATDTSTEEFDELVEELARLVNHHLTEEELSILNPAREDLDDDEKARLGAAFADTRNDLIEQGCGSLEHVRSLVAAAKKDDLLDD